MTKYTAQCMDAYYDESEGTLALYCWLEELKEKRIIVFTKADFVSNGEEASDEEMFKTAEIWKGKVWNFVTEDSPDKVELSPEDMYAHEKVYIGEIGDKMMKASEDMSSEKYRLEQKLAQFKRQNEAKQRIRDVGGL